MAHINVTMKRIFIYLIGLFFLSLGVSFSIEAALGVSPVSSLAYAFALTSGLSVGMMTVVANIIFIIIQVILKKRFDFRDSLVQLIIAFLFGSFIDITLIFVQLLPTPETAVLQWGFLLISLCLMPIGLLGCFSAKFTLMPYDELTHVISETFNINLGKAKIYGDSLSVIMAGLVCLVFIQSLGSVGIGTIVAAYLVGKILGWLTKRYQKYIFQWVYKNNKRTPKKAKDKLVRQDKKAPLSTLETDN